MLKNFKMMQKLENKLKEQYTHVQFITEMPGHLFVFEVGETKEASEQKVYNAEGFEVQMLGEFQV